jgi:hypothetical protein
LKGSKVHIFSQEERVVKIALLLVIVALGVAGYMLLAGPKKEPADFNGIKWGSTIGELAGMKLLAEEGNFKFFEKENERTKISDADVDKIVYGFYKDRFYNVTIYYRLPATFAKLQEAFSREFGKPFQPNASEKKLFWSGEHVNLLLNFDDASNSGRVSYLFKPIQLEIEVSG